jgi:hypothetical protein
MITSIRGSRDSSTPSSSSGTPPRPPPRPASPNAPRGTRHRDDDIQAAITERRAPILKAAAETLGIRSLDVIQALAAIAFVDPRRIARWGPNGITLTPSDELTDQDARAVAEVCGAKRS